MTWHRYKCGQAITYVHQGCDVWFEKPRQNDVDSGWYWGHPDNGHGMALGPYNTKREACAKAEAWLADRPQGDALLCAHGRKVGMFCPHCGQVVECSDAD